MQILKQLKKFRPFKIMKSREMREENHWTRMSGDYEYEDDIEYYAEHYTNRKTWWQHIQAGLKNLMEYISVRDKMRVKIIQLQRQLSGMMREAQEAGSVGLQLFDENAKLKARLDIAQLSADPEVFGKMWVEKKQIDKVNAELAEMKKKNLKYLNMYEEMNQQRIDAVTIADALRSELNELKEKKNGESSN